MYIDKVSLITIASSITCFNKFDLQGLKQRCPHILHPSTSPIWFMMYVSWVFFSLLCFRWASSNELLMNMSGWTASSRVRRTHHASRVTACETVPENGLPGCRHNTQLLKYLNIRSLLHFPCNYAWSFSIPPRYGQHTCAHIDLQFVGVHKQVWVDTPDSMTLWRCVCVLVILV